jgi:hypothetical protein
MKTEVKIFPLSAFDSLADGQPVAAIKGTITKLYDAKGGTNSVGKWQIQNAEIEADGITLPVMFKDRDAIDKSWKGKTILLTAKVDKSMTGLYVFDDTKNDVTIRKLKVTTTATIEIVYDDAKTQSAAAPNLQQHQQQPTERLTNPADPAPANKPADPAPQTGGKPQRTKEEQEFHDAQKTVVQIANLHLTCMLAVERYEAPAFKKLTGQDMSESQRQAACASIFIKADREGLVRYMPVVNAANDPRFQA